MNLTKNKFFSYHGIPGIEIDSQSTLKFSSHSRLVVEVKVLTEGPISVHMLLYKSRLIISFCQKMRLLEILFVSTVSIHDYDGLF